MERKIRERAKIMYKCKYFKIQELVNPSLLKKIGETIAWTIFDENLLILADALREKYGAITINTNGLTDCGLRDPQSKTGAKYSMHKIGRALDGHIVSIEKAAMKYINADERKNFKIKEYNKIRQELLKDPKFAKLNFENNINWLHFDTGNRQNRIFNP